MGFAPATSRQTPVSTPRALTSVGVASAGAHSTHVGTRATLLGTQVTPLGPRRTPFANLTNLCNSQVIYMLWYFRCVPAMHAGLY